MCLPQFKFHVSTFLCFILVLLESVLLGMGQNSTRHPSLVKLQHFFDIIVENVFNKIFRSWSMPSWNIDIGIGKNYWIRYCQEIGK